MIIQESQLNLISSGKFSSLNNERTNSKRVTESTNDSKFKDKPIVFLSHKHDELKPLEQTIKLIKNCGVDVYIDWMDEGMPKKTCIETAERIKDKIANSDKFILIGTEGAINSKWCNWELGIGDVHKFQDNIAIFPIRKNYSDYTGNEYIELYPTIQYENGLNGYILKEEFDKVDAYILQVKESKKQIVGRIPEGYYVHFQLEESGKIIEMEIRFEDWLRSK